VNTFVIPATTAPNPAIDVNIPRPAAPFAKIPSAITGRISKVPRIRKAYMLVI
tara:strand:+ start:534 stop:692 length:159 start_codon:yes stop_codon:yes gene_type:complete